MSRKKIFTPLGASNHSEGERAQHDYYATEEKAVYVLKEETGIILNKIIWEPACGAGHISQILEDGYGHTVRSTDLIYRGYGAPNSIDFLKNSDEWHGDIVTNPPFELAVPFVEMAIKSVEESASVVMFMKLIFLEGQKRKAFFKTYPPHTVYVSSSRLLCAKNGDFVEARKQSSAVCYAWYHWIKGYEGDTKIKWVN